MTRFTSIFALGLLALFRSAIALGPAPVALGSAGTYAVLAKSAISTVPSSAITGNIGLSPAAATFLTGFSLTPPTTFSTSTQVVGEVFAANYISPTPSILTTAVANMQTAYTDASTRASPNFSNLASGNIGGLTLAPGLYKWTTGVSIPTGVTISGSAIDTWIFQITGTVTMTAGVKIALSGGALAQNIVWAVAGSVTLGAGAHLEGIILGATAVTLDTGASMNGRILSQTSVSLQKATVIQPLL